MDKKTTQTCLFFLFAADNKNMLVRATQDLGDLRSRIVDLHEAGKASADLRYVTNSLAYRQTRGGRIVTLWACGVSEA